MTSFKHIRIPQDAFLDEGLAGRITHMYMGHADIRIIHRMHMFVLHTLFVCIYMCLYVYLYVFVYIYICIYIFLCSFFQVA